MLHEQELELSHRVNDAYIAWQELLERGVVREDKLRPDIAESWKRCQKANLKIWANPQKKITTELFVRQEKNKDALQLIRSVLECINVLINSFGVICDADGFAFEITSPLNNFPHNNGSFFDEAHAGSMAPAITLTKQIPYRTDKYEHYLFYQQRGSMASAPILDINGQLVYVLAAASPLDMIHLNALPVIVVLAKVLEYHLHNNIMKLNISLTKGFFIEALKLTNKEIIILDDKFNILLVSQKLLERMNITTSDQDHATEYFLEETHLMKDMLNENSFVEPRTIFHLVNPAGHKKLELYFADRKIIHISESERHIVLTFNESDHYDNKELADANSDNNKEVTSIGESPAWKNIMEKLPSIAPYLSNVILQGESGTGKEVLARSIHQYSKRNGVFTAINCGAYPRDLLYSEFFGYAEGAFTGARKGGSIGIFEHSNGGTVFLDEISELPLDLQPLLLRVIEQRAITRYGTTNLVPIDVLIIAASNQNLPRLVNEGKFRQDLLYRLNTFDLHLPALRERKDDIPLLARHFIAKFSREFNLRPPVVSDDFLNLLMNYNWPGNIRELKNVIERAVILSAGLNKDLTVKELPSSITQYYPDPHADSESNEREKIIKELEQTNSNIAKAARHLNMTRNTLYNKIKKYHIDLDIYR